jgi:hypothetical protein
MQRVKLIDTVTDWDTGKESIKVSEEYVGVIRQDVSPMGVIGIQLYTGVQHVFDLSSFYKLECEPMTDEEILATEGLGEWYQEQIDNAEEAAVQSAPEEPTH